VAELPLSREHHRDVVLVRRLHDLFVADGAAGLNDGADARFRRLSPFHMLLSR